MSTVDPTTEEIPWPTRGAPPRLLEVEDLAVEYATDDGPLWALDGVALTVKVGETVALVGESGSGKTTLALAVLGLLDPAGARIAAGDVRFDGRSLVGLSEREYRRLRGGDLAMVFQDPFAALHPMRPVGEQVGEAMRLHGVGRREARRRAVALLEDVGIPDAARRAGDHPHRLSGGMCQRVAIAMAVANRPRLLVADEPTSALDVTVQAQVLDLLARARADTGAALLLVTHDLAVVAAIADRVVVLYAGRVVEEGAVGAVLGSPRHPYTAGLLAALPGRGEPAGRLQAIPGAPPAPGSVRRGCPFAPRCPWVEERCRLEVPVLRAVGEGGPGGGSGHRSACLRAGELGARMVEVER